MKTIITTALFFLTMFQLSAQTGGIIYRDFEPDLDIEGYGDSLFVDIDQDGTEDLVMFIDIVYSTMEQDVFIATTSSSWCFRFCLSMGDEIFDENDTIVPYPMYWWCADPRMITWDNNTQDIMLGFRKTIDDTSYYAWAKIYMHRNEPNMVAYAFFDEIAYCTIPNYPLKWGQASCTDVDENNTTNFVSIYPTISTGHIKVSGENIEQIEIFDVIGNKVFGVSANTAATIDLSSQPAGIYFVSITSQDGKRCVKKVIKQ